MRIRLEDRLCFIVARDGSNHLRCFMPKLRALGFEVSRDIISVRLLYRLSYYAKSFLFGRVFMRGRFES